MKDAKARIGMNAARQERGRARLQPCQSGAIRHLSLVAYGMVGVIVSVARIIIATLREIFDEAAYTRFLQRHQISSSPQAYGSFLRERESAVAQRVRCC